MGFRDLECFNTIMLAKQCWRLVNNPSSLVDNILRGKYYRHEELLEVKPGHCPSYIWKSLCYDLDLVKEWLVWRVGDGKNV